MKLVLVGYYTALLALEGPQGLSYSSLGHEVDVLTDYRPLSGLFTGGTFPPDPPILPSGRVTLVTCS